MPIFRRSLPLGPWICSALRFTAPRQGEGVTGIEPASTGLKSRCGTVAAPRPLNYVVVRPAGFEPAAIEV